MKYKLSLKNKLMFGAAILISGGVAGMNSKIPSVPAAGTMDDALVEEISLRMGSSDKMFECKDILSAPSFKESVSWRYFNFWKTIDNLWPVITQKYGSVFSFLVKCKGENSNLPVLPEGCAKSRKVGLEYIFNNRREILKTIDMLQIVPDTSIANHHEVLSTIFPNYELLERTKISRQEDLKYIRTEAEDYLDFWKRIDDITPVIMKRGLNSFLKDCRDNNKNFSFSYFSYSKNCCTKIKYLFDNRDIILEAIDKMGIVPNPAIENHHNIFRIVFPDHILEGSELVPVDTLDAILDQIGQYVVIDPTMELDEDDRKLALDKAASSVLRSERSKRLFEEVSRFFPGYKQEDIVAFIERCREKNPGLPELSFYQIREKIGALMYIYDHSTEICESMVILKPERIEEIIEAYGHPNGMLRRRFEKLARYLVEHDGKFPSFRERLKLMQL